MPLTIWTWLLAALPIIAVLVLMMGFNWGGSRAGGAAWFIAIAVALLAFRASPQVIAYAQAKSLLLSLDVLYIIWTALLLFHVADEAGAVRVIGKHLPNLTADRMMQSLLLSWLFVSFLQGMGGFGVPVAVTAPLLIGLGFTPMQAVIMASLGHGWAVSFGSLATSFQALISASGLPGEVLAPQAAILLGAAAYVGGLMVAYVGSGWKGVLRSIPAVLILGTVMAVVQYLLATNGIWTLGATGATMVGLAVGVGVARLPLYQTRHLDEETSADDDDSTFAPEDPADGRERSLLLALSAYAILIVLAFSINLIPALDDLFNRVTVTLQFPELVTGFGWTTAAGTGKRISIFGHPGAILLYSSVASFFVYQRVGYYKPGAMKRIGQKVLKGAVKSSLGILAMVGMAVIMSHAGMTNLLARGISESVSNTIYPAVAPFVGALGAFMTGSNTNSNVVFGELQRQTAQLMGLSVTLILAAQTAGGALGSVLAPAKVIVGCSTVGLAGEEGAVLRRMILYGLIMVAFVAGLTMLMTR